MNFRAEEYFYAASERLRQAQLLHELKSHYALSMYCSGLAVECLLRAFRWKSETTFEGRHDLRELLRASRFLVVHEQTMRDHGVSESDIVEYSASLNAAINFVVVLWHNNLRYCSEAALKAFLKRIDHLKGIRGDPLRCNSKELLNAAQAILDRGVLLWTLKRK